MWRRRGRRGGEPGLGAKSAEAGSPRAAPAGTAPRSCGRKRVGRGSQEGHKRVTDLPELLAEILHLVPAVARRGSQEGRNRVATGSQEGLKRLTDLWELLPQVLHLVSAVVRRLEEGRMRVA